MELYLSMFVESIFYMCLYESLFSVSLTTPVINAVVNVILVKGWTIGMTRILKHFIANYLHLC